MLEEQGDELVLVDRVAVALGLLGEGLVRAVLPVDQRPIDVEGNELDVLGKWHERASVWRSG